VERKLKADPKDCVLISIDMQDKVIDITWDHDIIRPRAVAFATICREMRVPVIKLEHVPEKMGRTTETLAHALEGCPSATKTSFSAFGSRDFVGILEETGRKQLMLFGVEAHVCLCQSALDAVEAGYQVFVVADASSSTSPYHRDIAYERMRHAGITVATAQSLAFELVGRADAPEFRRILPYIKNL